MLQVAKPQIKFLSELFNIMFCINGKYNFSNLSCYSTYCDRTLRRWYSKPFDFVRFNILLFSQLPWSKLIAAIDTTLAQVSTWIFTRQSKRKSEYKIWKIKVCKLCQAWKKNWWKLFWLNNFYCLTDKVIVDTCGSKK